jgi:WD40 repeat protein
LYKPGGAEQLAELSFHGRINSFAWSSDGRRIAAAGEDPGAQGTKVVLWDGRSFEERRILRRPEHCYVRGATFSPDGKLFAAVLSTGGGNFELWNVATGEPALNPMEGSSLSHAGFGVPIAFSPGGDRFASVWCTEAEMWDLRSGRPLPTLKSHDDEICGVAFSSDGTSVMTADREGELRISDLGTGREIGRRGGLTTESGRVPLVLVGILAAWGLVWILLSLRFSPQSSGHHAVTLAALLAAVNGSHLLAYLQNSPKSADPIGTLMGLVFLSGLLSLSLLARAVACRMKKKPLHFPVIAFLLGAAVTVYDFRLLADVVASV